MPALSSRVDPFLRGTNHAITDLAPSGNAAMPPGRKLQLEFARRNFWLVPSRMNPGISIVSHPRARGLGNFTAPRILLSFAEAIFRMRRLLTLLAIVFLCSISALAQNSMDLFGGYCYQGLGRLPQAMPGRNLSGVKVAVQYNFRKGLGFQGEVEGHFGSEPPARGLDIPAGPQIYLPAHLFSRFCNVLAGYDCAYTNGIWDNSFAKAMGGGVDWQVAPRICWRRIKGDDVIPWHFGGIAHNPGISTGMILHF